MNRRFLQLSSILLVLAGTAFAQSGAEAGSRGNYGKVYEAAGGSAAGRDVKQKLNVTLMQAVQKARNFRADPSSGKTVKRTTRAATTAKNSTKIPAAKTNTATSISVRRDVGSFTADPRLDNLNRLADQLGNTQFERNYLRQLFATVKTSFEAEVKKRGRDNNLASALTFFVASTVTVYNDVPEPSDAAIDNLWNGFNTVFDENPDFAALTNRDKQEFYDTLIAFGGLSLAGYTLGKSSNDSNMVTMYRQIAGMFIQLVLKSDPNRMRFVGDQLVIS